MKLSELTTEQAADALCELAPYIDSITHDESILSEIGKVENFENGITQQGLVLVWAGRISKLIPVLLRTHRDDVYGILSIINEKCVDEIAKQSIKETIKQVKNAVEDEDLMSFFDLSASQGKSEQSAPSVGSQGSE